MLPSLPVSSFFLLVVFGTALASCIGERRACAGVWCEAVHGLRSSLMLLYGHGVCFLQCFTVNSVEDCLHSASNSGFVSEEAAVQKSSGSLVPVSCFVLCEITPFTQARTAVMWK